MPEQGKPGLEEGWYWVRYGDRDRWEAGRLRHFAGMGHNPWIKTVHGHFAPAHAFAQIGPRLLPPMPEPRLTRQEDEGLQAIFEGKDTAAKERAVMARCPELSEWLKDCGLAAVKSSRACQQFINAVGALTEPQPVQPVKPEELAAGVLVKRNPNGPVLKIIKNSTGYTLLLNEQEATFFDATEPVTPSRTKSDEPNSYPNYGASNYRVAEWTKNLATAV